MRIGVLNPQPDPLSSKNWSGTPRGIADGLTALGVEVVPLGTRLPVGIHHGVAVLSRIGGKRGAVADRTPVRQRSRTWALGRHLDEAGPLDGIVAMGQETYDLAALRRPGVPILTYDDTTLRQMWQHPDSDIRTAGFPESAVSLWCERQRASSLAADRCCVSTRWAGDSFIADYGITPDRVTVVGIGHRPRGTDARVGRDWDTPRFLFVGVDWKRKNGDAVVRAFRALRRVHPEITLDLVGNHPRVDEPGVHGHGFLARENADDQARLDALFAAATAFVLPSRFDPAGIAYLEAASAGLPVIATSQGGAVELLGDAAITVHPDDDDALQAGMLRLSSPGTARAMGARAAAIAKVSRWVDVAGRIVAVLHQQTAEDRSVGRPTTPDTETTVQEQS
jgi:glycosyltransferase involved in cell wall biosynthesis